MNCRAFFFAMAGSLCISCCAVADKAPLSENQLQAEADCIVIASIQRIRIETEESAYERSWGNSDWGIYLTLQIRSVEKGDMEDESIEARCFRVKTRRSLQEYATPNGHDPIPAVGTEVRAHLKGNNGSWEVVLPNGLTSPDGDKASAGVFEDATEVAGLRSLTYSFLIPLEAWAILLFVAGISAAAMVWMKRSRDMPAPVADTLSVDS